MSFKDVIKSSVYESLGGGTSLSTGSIALILVFALLIGLYIFAVYKLSSKAAFYSKDLNITIAGIPIVIAAIMIAMQSNFIVSLGMVGALSIIRFRTAVKNPLDLLYLFWAVSAGIICGVGLRILAVVLCITMTALILGLQLLPNSKTSSILVLRFEEDDVELEEIQATIHSYSRNVKQKSKNIRKNGTEVIYELTTKREEELVKALRAYNKIAEISFLLHDGEYRI